MTSFKTDRPFPIKCTLKLGYMPNFFAKIENRNVYKQKRACIIKHRRAFAYLAKKISDRESKLLDTYQSKYCGFELLLL